MAAVTPIRSEPDLAAEERELAACLMGQAVRAAILLLNHGERPQLAAEVLTLARDRWNSVCPVRS